MVGNLFKKIVLEVFRSIFKFEGGILSQEGEMGQIGKLPLKILEMDIFLD